MAGNVGHLEYMYDDYDKQIRRIVPIYEEMNQEILKRITLQKSDLNILDLGIGAGYLSFRLLQKFPNSFITGVDYEEKMIKKSRERISQLTENFQLLQSLENTFPHFSVEMNKTRLKGA